VALGLLATVIACYWAALQFRLLWVFWLIFPIALLYGLARAFGRPLLDGARTSVRRVRDYDRVSAAAASAIAERDELRQKLAVSETVVQDATDGAIMEGRKRAVGELLGAQTAAELTLLHCQVENEQLLLVAHVSGGALPPVGSRLFLRLEEGVRAKAALRVSAVAPERGNVVLVVDQVIDPGFMEGVHMRALAMSDPPPGAVVVPRAIEDIYGLQREVDQ